MDTPEQVAEVFRYYYELSVSHFLTLDFSPLIGAIEYRREFDSSDTPPDHGASE